MPKTLGIWEWGCPKRGDAQNAVTPPPWRGLERVGKNPGNEVGAGYPIISPPPMIMVKAIFTITVKKPETALSQRRAGGCRMSSCFYGNKRDIATNAFYVVTTKF